MKSLTKIYFSICISLFISCGTTDGLKNVSFSHRIGFKKYTYKMAIPKKFEIKYVRGDGEDKMEKQFWYSDSSVTYVSDFENNLNYDNIRALSSLYAKDAKAFVFRDTLMLEGKTKTGLYWKNIRYNNVSIGYNNVNLQQKSIYDQSLNTWR